jgi:hypothetical protein
MIRHCQGSCVNHCGKPIDVIDDDASGDTAANDDGNGGPMAGPYDDDVMGGNDGMAGVESDGQSYLLEWRCIFHTVLAVLIGFFLSKSRL